MSEVNQKLMETEVQWVKMRHFGITLSLQLFGNFFPLSGLSAVFPRIFTVFSLFIFFALFFLSEIPAKAIGLPTNMGPLIHKFRPTLDPGVETEALGPLLGWRQEGESSLFRLSPLFSYYHNPGIPQTEFDLLYPILTVDKYGQEYRAQLLQWLSMAGGASFTATNKSRTTIFPFLFIQRSPKAEENYWALVPIYGHLKNRFFRDEVYFVMLPIYLQSRKRDVVTDNFLFPVIHLRKGNGLKGWQVWPLVGRERKEVTTRTNGFGDKEIIGGHEKFFAPWPLFFKNTIGIGTTNRENQLIALPFYANLQSTQRQTTMYGFPLGVTHIQDRVNRYEEWGAPWPLVVYTTGEGKYTRRIWPFFGTSTNASLESTFYAWPIYKLNRARGDTLHRRRTRILLFLYSDLIEENTVRKTALRRRDFWPLFTHRSDHAGNSRLQILSILEPILPNNKSIDRLYSPVYSIWRSEYNAKTKERSHSLLWNLYRSESSPERRKKTALFGLFQHERLPGKTRGKIFYIPYERETE